MEEMFECFLYLDVYILNYEVALRTYTTLVFVVNGLCDMSSGS